MKRYEILVGRKLRWLMIFGCLMIVLRVATPALAVSDAEPFEEELAVEQIRLISTMSVEMINNAIGREIPEVSDGRKNIPFKGIGLHKPQGNKIGPPITSGADHGNKVLKNIDEALDNLNLFNGMTLGFIIIYVMVISW